MSALAMILVKRGHVVSGSDQGKKPSVQSLRAQGVNIFLKQSAANIDAISNEATLPPLIVISTAIPENNPELLAARQRSLKIWHRSDLLAALIEMQPSIAVAGSHGKTTTSTLLTTLLAVTNQDPTAVVGGVVPYYGTNGHAGAGRLLVAEADESDGSLVKFKAELGVITNLELDHTDHYADLDDLINTMKVFGNGCRRLLANHDCPVLREHVNASAWWSITTSEAVDFAALPVRLDGDQTIADIYEKNELIGRITLPMPGLHNLSNAMAAIAACRLEGLTFNQIEKGLTDLQPPGRRFDFRGSWKGRHVVDDYAHHPSEVRATLSMARLMISSGRSPLPSPPQRLVTVFQPHRYSRTAEFLSDFAIALKTSDVVLLAPVYSAGEQPIEGTNSERLAAEIRKLDTNLPIAVAESIDQLCILLETYSRKGDLVLAMGAGDVNSLWGRLINQNNNRWLSTLAA